MIRHYTTVQDCCNERGNGSGNAQGVGDAASPWLGDIRQAHTKLMAWRQGSCAPASVWKPCAPRTRGFGRQSVFPGLWRWSILLERASGSASGSTGPDSASSATAIPRVPTRPGSWPPPTKRAGAPSLWRGVPTVPSAPARNGRMSPGPLPPKQGQAPPQTVPDLGQMPLD